jgi:hypothetical protein
MEDGDRARRAHVRVEKVEAADRDAKGAGIDTLTVMMVDLSVGQIKQHTERKTMI